MKPLVTPWLEALEIEKAKQSKKWACPFCGSSDALHAYEDHFHCFSCGKTGDAIDLIMEVKKISFPKAAEMAGLEVQKFQKKPVAMRPRKKKKKEKMNPLLLTKLWKAMKPWPQKSPEKKEGLELLKYFEEHGIGQDELANTGQSCPVRVIPNKKYWKNILVSIYGDIPQWAMSPHGMVPKLPAIAYFYLGPKGAMYIKFRSIDGGHFAPKGYDPPYPFVTFPPSLGNIYKWKIAIIMEGEIDAFAASQDPKIWYPIGIPGASYTWNEDWNPLFSAPGLKTIRKWVVMGDGDKAGKLFSQRISRTLSETCAKPSKVFAGLWPEGSDFGDLCYQWGFETALEYAMDAKKRKDNE